MISKFALSALLALAVCGPVQEAAAQDAVGGAIVGGVLGGVVGGALGGRGGAAAGAIIGAGTGAAIASQGEARPGGYRYYQNGCYVEARRLGRGVAALLPDRGISRAAAAGLCRTAAPALHLLAVLRSAPRHLRRP